MNDNIEAEELETQSEMLLYSALDFDDSEVAPELGWCIPLSALDPRIHAIRNQEPSKNS